VQAVAAKAVKYHGCFSVSWLTQSGPPDVSFRKVPLQRANIKIRSLGLCPPHRWNPCKQLVSWDLSFILSHLWAITTLPLHLTQLHTT
jgi:hypothetical protein